MTNPKEFHYFVGGDRRVPRLEDQRANRSASMGDHSVSDRRANSSNSAYHRSMEAGLLQAQSTRPDALREPGEEQPRVQPFHRPGKE